MLTHGSIQRSTFKLTSCNDANCAGDDEHTETFEGRGSYARLLIDNAGFPVMLSSDNDKGDLWMLRCNDTKCAGGVDSHELFFSSRVANTFRGVSYALDANEHPVVAVSHSFLTLTVIVCNDTNCAGSDENVVDLQSGVLARGPRLVLDASGLPVIGYSSYFKEGVTPPDSELHLLTCQDRLCASGGKTFIGDRAGASGSPQVVLDENGFPVLQYFQRDPRNSRKVMHCGTTDCGAEPLAFCEGRVATIVATGPSTHGTDGRDIIVGRDGVDRIFAGPGNDLICAGSGDDRIYGGDGDDKIYGQDGSDRMYGDAGNDEVFGQDGSDRIFGGVGDDHLSGGDGPDRLFGQPGDDWIEGGYGDDRLVGGRGDDALQGGAGVNTLIQ